MLGENSAFDQCSLTSTFGLSWFELLPAYVLFAYPGAKPLNIGTIAEVLFLYLKK